jgi:hypothetical protein
MAVDRESRRCGLRDALKLKSDSQPHIVFLVLVTENVTVVRGELFILVAESLTDRQLM